MDTYIKQPYSVPCIEKVQLDVTVSLQLFSDPDPMTEPTDWDWEMESTNPADLML